MVSGRERPCSPEVFPRHRLCGLRRPPRLAGCPLPGHGAPIRERGGERKGRAYRPPGRRAAPRVPGGPKTPQERIAEACGRSWGAQRWPGSSHHLPEQGAIAEGGGAPDTAEGPARRAPPTSRPLARGPQELPQWLGAEKCGCQDKVQDEEAQPGPGVQSPEHGENHLPRGPRSRLLPAPPPGGQDDGTCCPRPGPPHKGLLLHGAASVVARGPAGQLRAEACGLLTLRLWATRCQAHLVYY